MKVSLRKNFQIYGSLYIHVTIDFIQQLHNLYNMIPIDNNENSLLLYFSFYITHYGVDWEGPVPYIPEDNSIEVPLTTAPISPASMSLLQSQFPEEVILASDHHGVDVYCDVLHFVNQHIIV